MSAADVLAALTAAGIRLSTPDGETLRVDAPGGVLTAKHREQLRARKDELIKELQRRELQAYGRRGWIAIYSTHLDEAIIVAKDEKAAATAPEGFAIYTEAEIGHLQAVTPDTLRQVHQTKVFWRGSIMDYEPKEAGEE